MTDPTPNDPYTVALGALAATISDERRAQRFLDLTGIETDQLRARAGDPDLLAAVIGFLEAHEPDLLAVAGQIGVEPAAIVAARRALGGTEEMQ
ncbi:uncharacterized protein DUF3572 [Sphingomonas sp. F9_3S_D5_B_2]